MERHPGHGAHRCPIAVLPSAAVLWWGVGFLPWLCDGLRQAQGPIGAGGAVYGRLALPLLTTQMIELTVDAIVGGLIAGALVLLVDERRRWYGVAASSAGVALAVGVTLWASWAAVERNAMGEFPADPRVLTGLSVGVVLCALVGWVVGCVAGLGRVGVGFALAVAAGVAPAYLSSLFYSIVDSAAPLPVVGVAVGWCGAALLTLAFTQVGWRPWWHVLWWPVMFSVAWLMGPPLVTSVGYLQQYLSPGGFRADMLLEALSATVQVFTEAAVSSSVNRPLQWTVAVILGVGLTLWQRRRHAPTPAPPV